MVEQVELTGPWEALEGAGAELELVSIKQGEIQGFNHYDKADTFKVDKTVEEVRVSDYDALVLPGGVGSPGTLRMDETPSSFVHQFFEQGKPVGAICHAPWLLSRPGGPRPDADVVAVADDRPQERQRQQDRPGGRRRGRARDEPQAGRHPRFQREADRGVRRGSARAAGGEDGRLHLIAMIEENAAPVLANTPLS